jgi:dipeptidyl aminopeptidase/acylaminoacyl peptidase
MLGYPACDFAEIGDSNSRMTNFFMSVMCGTNWKEKPDFVDEFNIVHHVDESYPATYIWQCKDDDTVPFAGSVSMDKALSTLNIPHVFRAFEHGGHGIGTGEGTDAEGWIDEAVRFWHNYCKTNDAKPCFTDTILNRRS